MSAGTHVARDDVPMDRLYRLGDDQYHQMIDSEILDAETVERRDGILSVRHPASSDLLDQFYRMSVERYDEATSLGILTKDDPIELIEGLLVAKMRKTPRHSVSIGLTRDVLASLRPEGWHVSTYCPLVTGDSEPEPDQLVIRGDLRDYPDRHPGPRDVALAVEVADLSLDFDRSIKRRIYARAGVVAYWIVNLVDRQIEVHTGPSGPASSPSYARREVVGPDAEIPVILDGHEVGRVAVRDVLP